MGNQVLSIEQMQHLQELGVEKSNSDVFWVKYVGDEHVKLKNICKCGEFLVKTKGKTSITQKVEGCEVIPTFTLQDILEMLPSCIKEDFGDCYYLMIEQLSNDEEKDWNIRYCLYDYSLSKIQFASLNLLDAAYEMLCWCIENGYIKTK